MVQSKKIFYLPVQSKINFKKFTAGINHKQIPVNKYQKAVVKYYRMDGWIQSDRNGEDSPLLFQH